MTKNRNFAASLIDDYAELGLGEKVNDYTLRAHDGSGVLELDSIVSEENKVIGLEIISDGVSVEELLYEDEEFNEKLLRQVSAAMNV